jgi:hypothetical protein
MPEAVTYRMRGLFFRVTEEGASSRLTRCRRRGFATGFLAFGCVLNEPVEPLRNYQAAAFEKSSTSLRNTSRVT